MFNLLLFVAFYFFEHNPLQKIIGVSTSIFVYLLGIKLNILTSSGAHILSTGHGNFHIIQSFYEILTLLALTIPLYLENIQKGLKSSVWIVGVVIGYYTLLFGMIIILFENGINPILLVKYIKFNSEFLMIPIFLGFWYLINRIQINRQLIKI